MSQFIALEENTSCADLYAYCGLVGNLERPDEITSRLKIKPTWAFAKGQIIYSRGKPAGKRREGNWSISSKGQLETTSMERHLLFLLERLEPVKSELLEIAERLSLTVHFSCVWTFTDVIGGPILTTNTLRRIADLGAYLSIGTKSFRAYDDDDDDDNE